MRSAILPLVIALSLGSPLAADTTSDAEAAGSEGARLINAGKPREALPYLDKAIKLDPRNAKYFLHRGVAYCDLRQFDRSLEDVDQALALDPRYPQAMFNRGNLCQRVGRYKQAIAHYDKALKLDPPAWLEKMIRTAKANNEENQKSVLKGTLRAPEGDVAKLAKEAGTHQDALAFWKRIGTVENLSMQRTDSLGAGFRERTTYSTVRCACIQMPMGAGRKGWTPLPVYVPLERGEILNQTIALRCQPGVAILSSPDPLGYRSSHVKLYLEWLFYKSGI